MAKKNNNLVSSKVVMAYLSKMGIPKAMLETIRVALCEEAVINGEAIKYNRIFTAIALMLRRHVGLEYGEEIMAALSYFNDICGQVKDDLITWPEMMKQCEEECGVVIHYEGEHMLCEYVGECEQEQDAKEEELEED